MWVSFFVSFFAFTLKRILHQMSKENLQTTINLSFLAYHRPISQHFFRQTTTFPMLHCQHFEVRHSNHIPAFQQNILHKILPFLCNTKYFLHKNAVSHVSTATCRELEYPHSRILKAHSHTLPGSIGDTACDASSASRKGLEQTHLRILPALQALWYAGDH